MATGGGGATAAAAWGPGSLRAWEMEEPSMLPFFVAAIAALNAFAGSSVLALGVGAAKRATRGTALAPARCSEGLCGSPRVSRPISVSSSERVSVPIDRWMNQRFSFVVRHCTNTDCTAQISIEIDLISNEKGPRTPSDQREIPIIERSPAIVGHGSFHGVVIFPELASQHLCW